jgi:SLT domain-containing protein
VNLSAEATAGLNGYLDRVNHAIALPPSQRMPLVDKLYRQIVAACEAKARLHGANEIGLELVEAEIDSLGPPEQIAAGLAEQHRWSPEAFGFDRAQFSERASQLARAAAERGEQVFLASIETAASALDLASQKLREAVERFKTKT